MPMQSITANVGKGDEKESRTVQIDVPEDVPAFVSKYGAEVCFSALVSQFRLDVQQIARECIAGAKDEAETQGAIDEWQWGVKRTRIPQDPKVRIANDIKKMSAEEKAEILQFLQDQG